MGNPFTSLADLIEQLLAARKPSTDIATRLNAIKSELDQISAFLGVQPDLLVVSGQEISDLREKIKAIRQSIGLFNP